MKQQQLEEQIHRLETDVMNLKHERQETIELLNSKDDEISELKRLLKKEERRTASLQEEAAKQAKAAARREAYVELLQSILADKALEVKGMDRLL